MKKDKLQAALRKPAKRSGELPVAGMVEDIVGCKWSMRLLGLVAAGCTRPSALLRECEGLSAKVMNERLNKMMRFGIAQRTVIGEKPPLEVQYRLTSFGNRFNDLIEQVRRLQAELDSSVEKGSEALATDVPVVRGASKASEAGPRKSTR